MAARSGAQAGNMQCHPGGHGVGGLRSSQAQQDEVSSPCQEQGRQGHQRGGIVVCGWDVVAAVGT